MIRRGPTEAARASPYPGTPPEQAGYWAGAFRKGGYAPACAPTCRTTWADGAPPDTSGRPPHLAGARACRPARGAGNRPAGHGRAGPSGGVPAALDRAAAGRRRGGPEVGRGGGPVAAVVDEKALDERLARLQAARAWSPRVVSRLEALVREGEDAALFRVNPFALAAAYHPSVWLTGWSERA